MFIRFIAISILVLVLYFLYKKFIAPSLKGESVSHAAKKAEINGLFQKLHEKEEIEKMLSSIKNPSTHQKGKRRNARTPR